jgi:arsenate reductase
MEKKRILFLCFDNAARSQMAEAFLRRAARDGFEVYSAGAEPTAIHTEAILVMAELGVDITSQRSKSIDAFEGQEFHYAVTVCDPVIEGCPVFSGEARYLHWSFKDPAAAIGSEEQRMRAFREVRDQIQVRIRQFVYEQCGFRRATHG